MTATDSEVSFGERMKAFHIVHKIVCDCCGVTFETKSNVKPPRFCSGACKKKYNEATGKYTVTRKCVMCGREFNTSKFKNTKCCSKSCAATLRPRTPDDKFFAAKGAESVCLY